MSGFTRLGLFRRRRNMQCVRDLAFLRGWRARGRPALKRKNARRCATKMHNFWFRPHRARRGRVRPAGIQSPGHWEGSRTFPANNPPSGLRGLQELPRQAPRTCTTSTIQKMLIVRIPGTQMREQILRPRELKCPCRPPRPRAAPLLLSSPEITYRRGWGLPSCVCL